MSRYIGARNLRAFAFNREGSPVGLRWWLAEAATSFTLQFLFVVGLTRAWPVSYTELLANGVRALHVLTD
jgi:hypothetical protein